MHESAWIEVFESRGALWIHDGNLRRPHALLTSGNHSNGFFNASMLLAYPGLMKQIAIALIDKILAGDIPDVVVTHVFGSALGAITLAHECAGRMNCLTGFTEPIKEGGVKRMVLKRFTVGAGNVIVVVEDVFTTGGTTEKTIEALEGSGATVVAPLGE